MIKIIVVLLLSLLITCLSTSPSIKKFVSKEKLVRNSISDLQNAFNNILNSNLTQLSSWQDSYGFILWKRYFSLNNYTNYTISTNLSLLEGNYSSGRIEIIGDPIQIDFEFDYKYEILFLPFIGRGKLTARADKFYMTRVYYLNEEGKLGVSTSFDVGCNNIKLNLTTGKLKDFIPIYNWAKTGIQNLLNDLSKTISNEINNYLFNLDNQRTINQTTSYSLQLNTFDRSTHKISKKLTEQPILNENGLVLSQEGSFDNSTVETSGNFSNFDSYFDYQIFVSRELIFYVLNSLSENNNFEVQINKSNLPENLLYNLDIQSLGQIYPEILSEKPSDENLYVNCLVKNLTISNILILEGVFNLICEVKSENDNSVVFSWDNFINYKGEIYTKNNSVDFKINKVDLLDITIPSTYTNVNLQTLMSWVEATLAKVFENNVVSLFGNSLKIPFNAGLKFYEDQGLVIFGNEISDSDNTLLNRTQEFIIKQILISKKNLKN